MKKKILITVLCAIGLFLVLACNVDLDTKTRHAVPKSSTGDTNSGLNDKDAEGLAFNEQLYRNQENSLSILNEAMIPFRKEYDSATGAEIYDDSFAGR